MHRAILSPAMLPNMVAAVLGEAVGCPFCQRPHLDEFKECGARALNARCVFWMRLDNMVKMESGGNDASRPKRGHSGTK